jgi:hypothetical protein
MANFEKQATQTLFDKNHITEEQLEVIKTYRGLNLFSVHNELKFLLYLSMLMFTSGIGILIYQNIDTIGHTALLGLLLLVTLTCFYFCFKNHDGFKREETAFANPLYDYLLLTAVILSCTFIGYLQFQYQTFGTHYGLATLIPTIISFFCAYYFDNKSVLSIAITGLAAYVGLSVSPQALLNNETYITTSLSYSGIILGIVLALWPIYATKNDLKKHFNLIYLTFSLHLISVACISNLFEDYWFAFIILLALSSFYFYKVSYQISSISIFVFTVLYAYIGFNVLFFQTLEAINSDSLAISLLFMSPFYFIISIVAFIKLVKNFNKKTSDDSIR